MFFGRKTLSYVTQRHGWIQELTPVGLDLNRCLRAPHGPMQEALRRLVVGSYRMDTYRGWELEVTTRLQSPVLLYRIQGWIGTSTATSNSRGLWFLNICHTISDCQSLTSCHMAHELESPLLQNTNIFALSWHRLLQPCRNLLLCGHAGPAGCAPFPPPCHRPSLKLCCANLQLNILGAPKLVCPDLYVDCSWS